MNYKYKIGDKVRIREDLVIDDLYDGALYVDNMNTYAGKVATITAHTGSFIPSYFIDLDEGCYHWTEKMFATYLPEDEEAIDPDAPVKDKPIVLHMTLEKFLLMADVETAGLVINIRKLNTNFEVTIGHNFIDKTDDMYKKFISSYGDYRVDYFEVRVEKEINGVSYPKLVIWITED